MAANTIKLIILSIIQNSEKMKFTDQSRNVILTNYKDCLGRFICKKNKLENR